MQIQTLVVTMNQRDHSLLDQMNIQTDAIVGNQCDRDEIERFEHHGKKVCWLSLRERGVGLNRNNVLMRGTADYLVLADDDMVFHDGYAKTVCDLFQRYPQADVLIFNLDEARPKRYKNTKVKKLNRSNYGKYGAARLALRRERIHMAGVSFNLLFGGGAKYSSGEDSIFLHDCLKKGLRLYAMPLAIAELKDDRASTWFTGYNDQFFTDKGVFFAQIYGWRSGLIALYHCFKHRNGRYREYGWKRAYQKIKEGIRTVS